MIDIARVRSDTPGTAAVAHFNNAGSSLPPRIVVDSVVDYLRAEERTGGYEVAEDRAADLQRVYGTTAAYLGCLPHEVAFTSSAGDSWWRAFSAVPLEAGDRILVSRSEYQANAFGWTQARQRGVDVAIIPNDPAGDLDLAALADMLDERVKLVSVTMVAMTNGAVQPVAEVGDLVRDSDAIYLLDACQAAGQLALDVESFGCDFLLYTGRKFMRGPRGSGVLYAADRVLDRLGPLSFVDGRSATWTAVDEFTYAPHAQRFEFGEYSYAGKVGLGVATEYMLGLGIESIEARVGNLAGALRNGLGSIDRVEVRDQGTRKSGIVTFTIEGMDLGAANQSLRDRGLNLSAPQRTMAQLELGERGIEQVLRAGVHYFNTEDEVARLCQAVSELGTNQ